MKITGVEIDNCFNLKNSKLDLKDGCTWIVGPNGSGKTNIIKCITFVVKQLMAYCSKTEFGLEKPENKHNDEDSIIKVHFDLGSEELLIFLGYSASMFVKSCGTFVGDPYCLLDDLPFPIFSGTITWTRNSNRLIIEFLGPKQTARRKSIENRRGKFLEWNLLVGRVKTQIREIRGVYKEVTLHTIVAYFMQTSLCIVNSESRGSLATECGSLFWDFPKFREKLVNASPSNVLSDELGSSESTNASTDAEQLEKFKSAMLCAGLEVKAAKGETGTTSGCSPHCVMLKKCHARNNPWEPLQSCSQGENDLLLTLSAICLSGSGNVILDEPGESFPPSQLRRVLDRNKDKVVLVTTHSLEMISPQWKPNLLYHMNQNGDSYTARLVTNSENRSNNGEIEKILDSATLDMVMAPEMRQIFISSGVIFVEGINDQRLLKVLREVKWEEGATATQPNVDRWDIIPMNGCQNWLKSYIAASHLGIPFVIVLDGDILKLKQKGDRQVSILQERLDLTEDMPDKLLILKNELTITKDPSEVRKIVQKYNIWVWPEHRDIEQSLFLIEEDSVTDKILACKEVMDELVGLYPLPNPKRLAVNIQASPELDGSQAPAEDDGQPTLSSATNDSRVKTFEDKVENPINKLFEKAKEKLKGIKESISRGRVTEIGNQFKDLGALMKSKLTQLPCQYDKGIKDKTKQNKTDWMNLAHQLHDGKWKLVSWKTLNTIVKLAIEVQDHPFNELWKYLTENRSGWRRSASETHDGRFELNIATSNQLLNTSEC